MTTPHDQTPSRSLGSAIRSTLLPVVVTLTLIAGVLFWMRGEFNEFRPTPEASGVPFTATVGQIAPDFSLYTSVKEFKTVSKLMSEESAKILIVNFWATWCQPCVTEMPSLEKLSQQYRAQGVRVVAVNIEPEAIAGALDKAKALKITFPIFHDVELKLGDLFDLHGLPSTLLINRDRKVLAFEKGERDWFGSEVRGFLEKQLADQSSKN